MITNYLAEIEEEIIAIRRKIHQHPELSFMEFATSELIFGELQTIPELQVTRPTPTSVLAVLKGRLPGITLAMRSDMDALNLDEGNDIDYKSRNGGVMHACGHDGHVAMLIGTAKILARLQHHVQGEIRFIFQHAEERHPGGARDLVSAGVIEGVDQIIAAHLWAGLETGKVGLTPGPLMAAPDNFTISIFGKGGHAAMPHQVVDPILISAQVITALQTVVSRNTDPLKPIVLSVTCINGGSAHNIIPESVEMKGTVRTFDPELREQVPQMMERVVQGNCLALGGSYSFRYEKGYNPVINSDQMIDHIRKIVEAQVPGQVIERVAPVMGGEDFSEYLKVVSGAMIFIGAGNQQEGIVFPHHHPCFNIDERALRNGTEIMVWVALGLLKRGK